MLSWLWKWRVSRMPLQIQKVVRDSRKLEEAYSREKQWEEIVSALLPDGPVAMLTTALLVRAIRDEAEMFRLVRRNEDVAFEVKECEDAWKSVFVIPQRVHRSVICNLRHRSGVDIFLRGAILKGYFLFEHEDKEFGVMVEFEPTDEGDEVVTGRIRTK